MSERTRGYADAIVAIASAEGALDSVEDELFVLARTVESNGELREKLSDIQIPVGTRLGFVESQALTSAHPATRSALAMIIAGGRITDLPAIATEVAAKAAATRDEDLAEVYVAVPLDESKKDALQRALEQSMGRRLDMHVFVDPSVVGGVRVKIGDTVIDGSLARRLDEVKTRLSR